MRISEQYRSDKAVLVAAAVADRAFDLHREPGSRNALDEDLLPGAPAFRLATILAVDGRAPD